MTDAADKSSEEKGQEIESPAGKTPDWMKLATSASSSGPALTDENTPAWLKSIRAGKGISKESEPAKPESPAASSSDSMSDLERLLAEEGIDLGSVVEERPEGSENMSARDWLIATSSEELIRSKLGAEPMPESVSSSGPAASSSDSMSDLERLLAEEGIDLGSVVEERPDEASGMSARDWLISTSSDELIRNKLGAEPLSTPVPAPTPVSSSVDDKMVVEEDLPDWLQEIAEESAAPEADLFAGGMETDADQLVVKDELPDWLQDIAEESTAPEISPVSLPELPEIPVTSSLFDDGTVVEEELPDWLREMGEETPPGQDEVQPPVASDLIVEEDLPDWLRQVEEEPSLTQIEPTNVMDTPPGPARFQEDKMVVEEDLPDWLREVEAEAPADTTTDSVWPDLSEVTPEFLAAADQVVLEEELPDWLRETEAGMAESEPEPGLSLAESDKMVVEEDLPDWLREVEAREAEGSLLLDSVQDELVSMGAEPTIPEADLPDWLREVEETGITAAGSTPRTVTPQGIPEPTVPVDEDHLDIADEDLPDWLREVQAEADSAPTRITGVEPLPPSLDAVKPGADMIIEEELPDWLREAQEELAPLSLTETQAASAIDHEAEPIVSEELPDWLQEVDTEFDELFEPSEPSPELFADVLPDDDLVVAEELPDWLREVESELPETAAEVEPVSPAAQAGIVVIEDELPDWLRGVEAELPGLTGATLEPITSTDEIINEADLPDWLRGTAAELPEITEETLKPISPVSAPIADEVEDQTGMPDWLPEVETEAVPVTEEEVISISEPATVSPEPLVMMASQPAEVEGVALEAPAPVAVEPPVVTAPSGIPDWLQKLREVEPEPAPLQPIPAPPPVMMAQAAPKPIEIPTVPVPNPEWPADADEQLKLARTARDKGEWDKAIPIYDSLVSKGVYLGKIIEDIQQAIKTHSANYQLYQLMGDAMMRDGRLQSALNAYREAMAKL